MMVSLLTPLWTQNSLAQVKSKCLTPTQVEALARTVQQRDQLQMDLESTDKYLKLCQETTCSQPDWWQEPASIAGISVGAFVLGLIVGIKGAK